VVAAIGIFVRPTVLIDATAKMSVVREEIFGAVACAMPFDDDLTGSQLRRATGAHG
jgi:acyl-CoA reductase-like NAD-dependent aldehyde dehydrogenase